MATYKRDSSDNIYDEKGNIINKRKKKTDNQISMNFDENNDFVIDSSVFERLDVLIFLPLHLLHPLPLK